VELKLSYKNIRNGLLGQTGWLRIVFLTPAIAGDAYGVQMLSHSQ